MPLKNCEFSWDDVNNEILDKEEWVEKIRNEGQCVASDKGQGYNTKCCIIIVVLSF